jgi:hypothetical protein
MSQDAMAKVIERASADAAFRAQLKANPGSALAGYDLTADERAAVLRGEAPEGGALGVDARVSKLDNPAMPGEALGPGNLDGGGGVGH